MVGNNFSVDSIEYAAQHENKMKKREKELIQSSNFQFQPVATNGSTEPDMFKHMNHIRNDTPDEDLNNSGDKRIEF